MHVHAGQHCNMVEYWRQRGPDLFVHCLVVCGPASSSSSCGMCSPTLATSCLALQLLLPGRFCVKLSGSPSAALEVLLQDHASTAATPGWVAVIICCRMYCCAPVLLCSLSMSGAAMVCKRSASSTTSSLHHTILCCTRLPQLTNASTMPDWMAFRWHWETHLVQHLQHCACRTVKA